MRYASGCADYTNRLIPGLRRDDFVRSNEVAIFSFLVPVLILLRLPVLGPLLFLPAAAAAAYLANFLDGLPSTREFKAPGHSISGTNSKAK